MDDEVELDEVELEEPAEEAVEEPEALVVAEETEVLEIADAPVFVEEESKTKKYVSALRRISVPGAVEAIGETISNAGVLIGSGIHFIVGGISQTPGVAEIILDTEKTDLCGEHREWICNPYNDTSRLYRNRNTENQCFSDWRQCNGGNGRHKNAETVKPRYICLTVWR